MDRLIRLKQIAKANLGEQSEAAQRVVDRHLRRKKYKLLWKLKTFSKLIW